MSHHHLVERLLKYRSVIVLGGIVAFVSVLAGLSLFKYAAFLYDGLDLAIFNQVIWNTAHGRWFEMSIHPHSYLGDHAALAILPLSFVYRILPDPRTLLVLQAAALGIAAWPLYRIAEERTKEFEGAVKLVPLFMAFAWLASPQLANAGLYEFHMLALAVPFLMWMLLAYERGNRASFVLLALITMTFREDLALVVATVSVLAMAEKRDWWWRTVPLIFGSVWFVSVLALISHFSPAAGSKFLVYYAWLGGDTIAEMIVGVFSHPWRVISHVMSLGTLEMLIGFGIPLLFFPYFAPKRLVLAFAPFLIIALGAPGASSLVLDTHYALLFLPAVMLAGTDGLVLLLTRTEMQGRLHARHAFGLAMITSAYAVFTLGPLPAGALAAMRGIPAEATAAETIVRLVPEDAAVAAGYRLLPRLSSRERVYSLHYLYLGVQQFGGLVGGGDYVPDPLPDYLVIDENDYLTYRAQFNATEWAKPYAPDGAQRLMDLHAERTARIDNFVLAQRRDDAIHPDAPNDFSPRVLDAELTASLDTIPSHADLVIRLSGSVAELTQHAGTVRIIDETGETIGRSTFPLGGPYLVDAPEDGSGGLIRELQLTLDRPPIGEFRAELTTFQQDAIMVLDRLGSTTLQVTDGRGAHSYAVPGVGEAE